MITQPQLSYIFSLLKYNNFQRAADACHVTQPTLSMQLKKTEEMIGFTIINRDTSPFSLTRNGEIILPKLQAIQDAYDELGIQIDKLEGNYKAEIRLGIIPTISSYLVPEIYAKWQKKMGKVHLDIIEMKSEQLLDAIKNKTIDFAIMAGPISDLTFDQQILYQEEILIYAPSFPKKTITIEELEGKRPWLLSKGNCLRTQMIDFCNLSKRDISAWNYEGGNLNVLINMVKQEGGYTLIPSHYIPHLSLNDNDLKRIKKRTPIRQVVGFSLKRNTKKIEIKELIHLVQHEKYSPLKSQENIELLPWRE